MPSPLDTGNVLPAYNDVTPRKQRRPWLNRSITTMSSFYARPKRLPGTSWMNKEFKNSFVASMGEFVGTTFFLFFAFAGTAVGSIPPGTDQGVASTVRMTPDSSVLLYISLAFSCSLAVNVWTFFRVSGGLFNPAVTFAFMLLGKIKFSRAISLLISQMLGGIVASLLCKALFPGNYDVTTKPSGGTSQAQAVFIEMFLTAQLVFTVLMLAVEKHRATFLAPIGIGLALFNIEMVGIYYTGGSANPARSFGPNVAAGKFESTHWIYWVGPGLGATLASLFYKFIKVLEYETANPNQDAKDTKIDNTAFWNYDPREYATRSPEPVRPNMLESQSQTGTTVTPDVERVVDIECVKNQVAR